MTTTDKVTIQDVAYGSAHGFTEPERMAILWQYREHLALGHFTTSLLALMDHADVENLQRISLGYPDLAEGVTRWRNEHGWAESIRERLDVG